ncbi:hypothetical protein HDV00_004864 [Rhizophlyctis rosea]|nr:hypothetical protein HDV00_004864 [Rhizophlyctis rosea]
MAASGLWVIAAAIHIFLMIRHKTWYLIPFIIGALLETAGYGLRIKARQNPHDTPTYAAQHGQIVIAPVFLAASVYMIMSRIILHVGPTNSPIPHRWVTRTFIGCDIFSFVIQISGTGILLGNTANADIGLKLLLVGLIVQVISFTGFIVLAYVVDKRAKAGGVKGKWRRLMVAVYFASFAILIRSIYRSIEFSQGFDSSLAHNEPSMYALDTLLMFLVLVAFIVVHPGPALRDTISPEPGTEDGYVALERRDRAAARV